MNDEKFETYLIAKTWRRIFARIIDIIFVSVLPLVVGIIWYSINKMQSAQWWAIMIVTLTTFILSIVYFVIIPWKFKGQTLGKKICFIRLVNEKQNSLSLKSVLYRELFLVFIPVFLSLMTINITSIFANTSIANVNPKTSSGFWINIFIRSTFSFIFAWYLGIMIVTKVDNKHQLFYDRKYHLFIVNSRAITKKIHPHDQEQASVIHVHLGNNQPGNIDFDELKKIQEL